MEEAWQYSAVMVMDTLLPGIIFSLGAIVFAYHAGLGWKTGTVRFPLSAFGMEEFERDRSAANFWGIVILDIVVALASLGFAIHFVIEGI